MTQIEMKQVSSLTTNALYQVMPHLDEEVYGALKEGISEDGLAVPLEIDEEGQILDGFHRLRACIELGIQEVPCLVRAGLSDEQKMVHAINLNLERRHLTRKQKRQLVRQLLRDNPEMSCNAVAYMVNVSHHTVGTIRETMESDGDIPKTETSTGRDGKTYPRVRMAEQVGKLPTSANSAPEPKPEPVPQTTEIDAVPKSNDADKQSQYESKPARSASPFVYEVVICDAVLEKGETHQLALKSAFNAAKSDCLMLLWVSTGQMAPVFEILRQGGWNVLDMLALDTGETRPGRYLQQQVHHCVIAARGQLTVATSSLSNIARAAGDEETRFVKAAEVARSLHPTSSTAYAYTASKTEGCERAKRRQWVKCDPAMSGRRS